MLIMKSFLDQNVLHVALWMKTTCISNLLLHSSVKPAEKQRHCSLRSITQKQIVSVGSHRSNMHEANWQWDQIAFFSLFLSPYHTRPQHKQRHSAAVQSERAVWLQAENVFCCFLSDCGTTQEAAGAEALMCAQDTKPGGFKLGS